MTVTTATGRNITINFVHSTHNAGKSDYKPRPNAGARRLQFDQDAANFEVKGSPVIGRRLTLCELSEDKSDGTGQNYQTLGEGVAVCHLRDSFSKPMGRKKALAAAMKAAELTFNERQTLWDVYLLEFGTA